MSKIEWTDKTWNPISGCEKVSSGCKNCYAETYADRFWCERKFADVQCHEDRLDQPLHWKKPRWVFVNSMSDLFHPGIPFDFIDKVFAVMALCPQHTFQVLTKRPERMREYIQRISEDQYPVQAHARDIGSGFNFASLPHIEWPLPNVWIGVSVEDQETADLRIPILLQTPAAVLFVSYEPALGPVDLSQYFADALADQDTIPFWCWEKNTGIDWIIMGGESGPNARPMHPDWARSVRDQCQAAGVPFFFKQWGEWKRCEGACDARKYKEGLVYPDGRFVQGRHRKNPDCEKAGMPVIRFGKKKAGRLLDGREWNDFPNAK